MKTRILNSSLALLGMFTLFDPWPMPTEAQLSKKNGRQNEAFIRYASGPGIINSVRRRITRDWSCYNNSLNNHTSVEFSISETGNIYNPQIKFFSSDEQYNAGCLEACCGLTPVDFGEAPGTPKIQKFSASFGQPADLPPEHSGEELLNYRRIHNLPLNADCKTVLVHKIPLDVLDRYPLMFTEKQLLCPENLLEIPIGAATESSSGPRETCPPYVSPILSLYSYWGELFKKPLVTREEIVQYSKSAQAHIKN